MFIIIGWIITFIFSTLVVKGTAVGPVILVISEARGWGVHTFDLITLIPIGFMCFLTYVWVTDPSKAL